MGSQIVVIHRRNRWTRKRPRRWTRHRKFEWILLTHRSRIAMAYRPFFGHYPVKRTSRGLGRPTPLGAREERWEPTNVKKVKLADRAAVSHLASLECQELPQLVPVVEALAMLQYDDGEPRKPGFLMVWTQGNTWFVKLKDNDSEASLPATGRTFIEALSLLALLLGAEDAPWEKNSQAEEMAAKRRNKK